MPHSRDVSAPSARTLHAATSMLVALLALAAAANASAADQSARVTSPTIAVTGTGEVVLDPDSATLTVSVDSDAPTGAAAAADNARVTAAVRSALSAAGAARADMTTENYSVEPQWQYSSSAPPRRIGFSAHTNLRVSVARLDQLGAWIDAALGAGASRIQGIEFSSSQSLRARAEALTRAVANARADAETLAKAAGGSLGPLQALSSEQATFPRPVLAQTVTLNAARAGEPTHIEPGPLHIQATVTASWAFEP
jgi:uncharacterized protein